MALLFSCVLKSSRLCFRFEFFVCFCCKCRDCGGGCVGGCGSKLSCREKIKVEIRIG